MELLQMVTPPPLSSLISSHKNKDYFEQGSRYDCAIDNRSNEIKLSIIVPVYNVLPYLDKCLSSLQIQDYNNCEFILIDDGSTDGSSELCRKFEQNDPRFKLIAHGENKGLMLARKTGIINASGEYILFLDGDDFYVDQGVLAYINNLIYINNNVDVIRFRCSVLGDNAEDLWNWINGDIENASLMTGDELLNKIYNNNLFGWNVWNKVYRADVLKKVIALVPDKYFVLAEDAFYTFLICYFSKSVIFANDKPIVCYRTDVGVSNSAICLNSFNKYTYEVECTFWLENIFRFDYPSKKYLDVVFKLRECLFDVLVRRMKKLPVESFSEGFGVLVNLPYLSDSISALRRAYRSPKSQINFVKGIFSLPIKRQKYEKIVVAFVYPRIFDGGVERVISLQIPIFLSLGYDVVLITESIDREIEYEIPNTVRRLTIPKTYEANRAYYIQKAIKELNINTVMYHQGASGDCLWDILLLRLLGCKVILSSHEVPMACTLRDPSRHTYEFDMSRPWIYKLANVVAVLDRSQVSFYNLFNVNAIFVPNPISIDPICMGDIPKAKDRAGVIWIGRLDDRQKSFKRVLDIFNVLSKRNKEIRCTLIGPEYDPDSGVYIEEYIRNNNLSENIEWLGRQNQVSKFLKKAKVFVMTSKFEAFPMVLVEAQSCGTPVVMFDLPYVELVKSKKGVCSFAFDDEVGFINEVERILADDDYCDRLIKESSYNLIEFYKTYNLSTMWKNIVEGDVSDKYCRFSKEDCVSSIMEQFQFINNGIFDEQVRGNSRYGKVKSRKIVKKLVCFRTLKYLMLSYLAVNAVKRQHYREKLLAYVTGDRGWIS